MQTTLNPKPTDDPHDVLVVAPGVAVMVPTDEELSKLARSLRHPPFPPGPIQSDLSPAPAVPPVDTTFRAAAVGDVRIPGRPTKRGKAARAFMAAFLLAACMGAASIASQSYGDAAEAMIARWSPQRILALLAPEKPALDVQPVPAAVEAATATAGPDPAQAGVAAANTTAMVAPAAATPSAEATPPPGSMPNELASARQEIEQLKATIEGLKASQQQMSRDLAKASELKGSDARISDAKVSEVRPSGQNLRPKMPAHPPRTAAAWTRKPVPPPYPVQQAVTAPALPQAAPYAPRPVEPPPQTTGVTLTDPELASVPRPPMPVR